MGVHDLHVASTVVYLELRELPDECRPCMITRHAGATLLVCDPRETRRVVTEWNVDHLTPTEVDILRAGFGLPPTGTSAPDWITQEKPCFLYVPPALRLPGANAIQGGHEAARRSRAGELYEEMRAYAEEISQATVTGA